MSCSNTELACSPAAATAAATAESQLYIPPYTDVFTALYSGTSLLQPSELRTPPLCGRPSRTTLRGSVHLVDLRTKDTDDRSQHKNNIEFR